MTRLKTPPPQPEPLTTTKSTAALNAVRDQNRVSWRAHATRYVQGRPWGYWLPDGHTYRTSEPQAWSAWCAAAGVPLTRGVESRGGVGRTLYLPTRTLKLLRELGENESFVETIDRLAHGEAARRLASAGPAADVHPPERADAAG